MKKPAILGKIWEQFVPNGNNLDGLEVIYEILKKRRCIWCVPDLGGYDEAHTSTWTEQAGSRDKVRRP